MAKGTSLVSRTIKWLKDNGFTDIAKVEYYNMFAHKRQDLWGLFDIVCLMPPKPTSALRNVHHYKYIECHVQVCALNQKNPHLDKFRASETCIRLLQCPCIQMLICWHQLCKIKKDGKKSKVKEWHCEVIEITSEVLK